MTSASNQGESDENMNDPLTSVPPTNTSEVMPSELERGPYQETDILPDETLEGVFDIKVVDIAKDGTHHFLNGLFMNQQYLDNQLATLIDAAPKDELRVIIAEKAMNSSRTVPLGWLLERTKNSAEEVDSLIWGPHDPAQFRRLLRYCLGDQHTAFWARYHCWAQYRYSNSYKILFKWMEVSPEHLICMMIFDNDFLTDTGRGAFLRWISKHQLLSATRFCDDTLQTLGKLFLMDVMRFITSNGVRHLRSEIDSFRTMSGRVDEDGLTDAPDYPVDTLSDQILALLESLNLSTSTKFRPESTGSLDVIAEDLVVRLDFMKRCVRQMKDMHHARLNSYITQSNLRESRAVKRLAVLASIFLPLSLGAGILITASPKFQWVRFLNQKIVETLGRWHLRSQGVKKRAKLERRLERLLWKVLGLPGLITIVVALNLGVFGNIQYAWRILVGGLAGGVGLYVLLVMWFMVADRLLRRWYKRRRDERMGST